MVCRRILIASDRLAALSWRYAPGRPLVPPSLSLSLELAMDPITAGLITGGAGIISSIFSANTSAQNAQLASQTATQNSREQIAAQKEMLGQTEDFNAAQAGLSRDFTAGQQWNAENFNASMMREAQGFNAGEVDKQRAFNATQSQIQRDYETQMSNTAYQRAAADMKAAGLNPMMMFGSGSMSSTPSVGAASSGAASSSGASVGMGSGATASVGTPSVPMKSFAPPKSGNIFADLGDTVSKAVGSAVQAKQIEKMTDEIANLGVQRQLIEAQTGTERERPESVRASTHLTKTEETLKEFQLPQARFSAKMAEDLSSIPDWLRRAAVTSSFTGGKISDAIAPLVSAAGVISKFTGR